MRKRRKIRAAGILTMLMLAGSLTVSGKTFATEAASTETASTQEQTLHNNVSQKITKANTDISMDVMCGINGVVTYDNPIWISVTVESKKDFTGYIKIKPSESYGNKIVAYAEDISLAAGSKKTFQFLLNNSNNDGRLDIALCNEKNKTVYAETDTVNMESTGNDIFMGVLTDDYSGISYMNLAKATFAGYEQNVRLLELNEDSFPQMSGALNAMSYLLIDNYDTAQLSKEQYEALKSWVNDGGVLIVTLGPNYQNVLHCFEDGFLSGTIGSLTKEDLSWETGTGSIAQAENVDVCEFSMDGAEKLAGFCEQDGYAYKKDSGSGEIIVLGYDLGMEPFVGMDGNREILVKLLERSMGGKTLNRVSGSSGNYYYSSQDVAKMMNETKSPSTLLFGLVLVVYVVLVGPGIYLILKKINRREKIWIAIPATAAACTLLIFVLSLFYRVRKPIVNSFDVIQLSTDVKQENVFANIISPKAKDYEMMLEPSYQNVMARDDYSYSIFSSASGNSEGVDYDLMVKKQNDGTKLILHNTSAFQEKNFSVDRTSENELGMLDLDLHCYTDGFEGTVTNHMNCDLQNVVVNFENHYYMIDELKKGESAQIDSSKLIERNYYETFYSVMMQDTTGLSKAEQKLRNKYYNINNFMENSYVQNSVYKQGCVWADAGSYTPKIVDDSSVVQYGEAVVYMPFTAEYEDVTGTYCPDLNEAIVSSEDGYDTSDRMIYNDIVTIDYDLSAYGTVTELTNMNYGDKSPQDGGSYSPVYAYNPDTDTYDLIFENSETISGDELKKYLSDNKITLRFEGNSNGYPMYMPKISAKGDE